MNQPDMTLTFFYLALVALVWMSFKYRKVKKERDAYASLFQVVDPAPTKEQRVTTPNQPLREQPLR